MATMDWLQFAIHRSQIQLRREHYQLLDNYIFISIYAELSQLFKCCEDHDEFILVNHVSGVGAMQERKNLMGEIIKDILHSEEYTLDGIAYYTQTDVDIIYEIMIGLNPNPSIALARRIISLHKDVRPNLYQQLIKLCIERHAKEMDSQV